MQCLPSLVWNRFGGRVTVAEMKRRLENILGASPQERAERLEALGERPDLLDFETCWDDEPFDWLEDGSVVFVDGDYEDVPIERSEATQPIERSE